jgi:hypothetical protein
MSSFSYLSLPDALARVILVEWLDLKQVVRLDSAVCSRGKRERAQVALLAYGQLSTLAVRVAHPCKCFNNVLAWAIYKEARLDRVCLCRSSIATEESLQLLEAFLARSGPAVLGIHCYINTGALSDALRRALLLVAKWCPNVISFHGLCFRTDSLWHECLATLASAWPKLNILSLFGMELSEEDLARALRQCVALEHLEVLTRCQLLPLETAIPSLKSLKTRSCNVSDELLIAIGHRCDKLETLEISSDCTKVYTVTDAAVRAFLQGCPLLRKTDMAQAGGFGNELRVELAKRCCFKQLWLSSWHDMSEELAQAVLKVSPALQELYLYCCEWLTDATLAVCAQHCPRLHKLAIVVNPHVTPDGVRALVTTLGHKLRSVFLQCCDQLGDEVVLAIAEHCPLLEHFGAPPNVTEVAFAKLRASCANF